MGNQYGIAKLELLDECDSPLTKEFRMDMARLEIPVSGCTCLRTGECHVSKRVFETKVRRWMSYPCRCRRSRSPCGSWCASSSRLTGPRSSCQPPSSPQGPCQLVPCRRWRESSAMGVRNCAKSRDGARECASDGAGNAPVLPWEPFLLMLGLKDAVFLVEIG